VDESLFSDAWYRVAERRPRLRSEVRVQRQLVRGEPWYVLDNPLNGRQLRVNRKAYELIGRCDGAFTLCRVWEALVAERGDDAPTQDEVVRTLSTLEAQGMLAHDMASESLHSARERRRQARVQAFVNPFALRVPLGNPSRVLTLLDPLARAVFNRLALALWLLAVSTAGAVAATQWSVLAAHARSYMATPRYVVCAWIAFPLLKALHELAHALAARRWGGTLREAGFTLFVLVPAPYVDASTAACFPRRHQRFFVAAAGMMGELAAASFAFAIWLNAEPGMLRDMAFVVMTIAAVSTIAFNANPLLRFDGYYMLCDALQLPNLAQRSTTWWSGLVRTMLFTSPARTGLQPAPGELKWLIAYAPLAAAYRLLVAGCIVLWLGAQSTALGAAAALMVATGLLIRPLWAALRGLGAAVPSVRERVRACGVLAGVLVVCAAAAALPLPSYTVVQGLVSAPERSHVRAGTNGFMTALMAGDSDTVTAGQVLLVLEEPALLTERAKTASRLERLHASRFAALVDSAERARQLDEEIARSESELERLEERIAALEVRAPIDGVWVMPRQRDLLNTYIREGSTLGYVLDHTPVQVRAAVPEYDAPRVRRRTLAIEARLAEARAFVPARLIRDVPAATFDLPGAALGDRGGGPYPTEAEDSGGTRSREPVVLMDIELPSLRVQRVGSRAWVRFDVGAEPLAQRGYRTLRQIFLRHFNTTS
jgi:putative peptide zinc metalloprotease protein